LKGHGWKWLRKNSERQSFERARLPTVPQVIETMCGAAEASLFQSETPNQ
jgi:hypothetical protein